MADTDDMDLIRVAVLGRSVDESTTWTTTGPAGNRNTLNTSERIVNRAINYLDTHIGNVEIAANTFHDRFDGVVGNETGADQAAFNTLGKNLIQSVAELAGRTGGGAWGEVTGNLDDQLDLKARLEAIDTRIEGVENLGHYAGAFDTRASLPANRSGFPGSITVNDFVTIRADETRGGVTTRYVATAIAGNGAITWTYDLTYSADISGKMDVVLGAAAGNLAKFGAGGQVVDGGPTPVIPDITGKMNLVTPAPEANTLAQLNATGQATSAGFLTSEVVRTTTNQTLAGTKTFSSPVVIPDATGNTHAVNLDQLRLTTPRYKYNSTSGGLGFHIKTDITPTATGFVRCKIYGNLYTSLRQINTDISFYHAATGVITNTTFVMNNYGLEFTSCSAFTDADGTFSIYVPISDRYYNLYVEVYANSAATTMTTTVQRNRVFSITQVTAHLLAEGRTNWMQIPIGNVFNYGSVADRAKTVWVATENGDDLRRGAARSSAVRTVAQALKLASGSNYGLIYINRFTTAAPAAYASTTAYAEGALCTSGGYVWRRVTAGTGTTPAITATVWQFVNDTTSPQQRGPFSATDTYAAGDIVTFTGTATNSQTITYMCMVAISGNQGAHTTPTGTLTPNRNWAPVGAYNPIIPAITLNNFSGLRIITGNSTSTLEALDVLCYGGVNLANNKHVLLESRLRCQTLTLDYNAAFYTSQVLSATLIQGHYMGTARFNTTVHVFGYVTHTNAARVVYYGTTTIVPDTPARVAVTATNSEIQFSGALTLTGNNQGNSSTTLAAANTGKGLLAAHGAKIMMIGEASTVTINAFGTAISVETGSEVEARCRTLSMNKSNNLSETDTIAISVTVAGRFVGSRNTTTYTRTSCADNIATTGTVLDYRKLAAAGLLGFHVTSELPLSEAPTDGSLYARQGSTRSWQPLPTPA